jgi:hypothetical protein
LINHEFGFFDYSYLTYPSPSIPLPQGARKVEEKGISRSPQFPTKIETGKIEENDLEKISQSPRFRRAGCENPPLLYDSIKLRD